MFRRADIRLGVLLGALLWSTPLEAQSRFHTQADRALGQYLEERGLDALLASHLWAMLDRVTASEREEIANRLGRLYVKMLDGDLSLSDRMLIEQRSRELLDRVPEASSFDLRISLAKASYLVAEKDAERHRLRLISPEEAAEAERALRSVSDVFREIGSKANRLVDMLERREESPFEENITAVRAELADARRIRSLAMYYAAWSSYYIGLLTGVEEHAVEALRFFGWLLNSTGGQIPSVESAPERLFRFEHVARAAMGAALSESMRGNTADAERWLDKIERSSELSPSVRAQLGTRRLIVAAEAKKWSDLDWTLDQLREMSDDGLAATADARLVAVYALEALGRAGLPQRARPTVEEIASEALSDLVTLGEIAHVLDLVLRYGSAQLGSEGFIVHYVRGLQAYERVRDVHADVGDAEEPSEDERTRGLYREAVDILRAAVQMSDADRFPKQRGNARLLMGLSLYYAGDYMPAADFLEKAHSDAPSSEQAEEALWLAVVALDRAVDAGRISLTQRRDRLAELFLRSYPSGERAAKLLLRRAAAGSLPDDQAVEILLDVEQTSPLYGAARRHAARLLYRLFREAPQGEADFAALRFVTVAEQVLAMDRKAAIGADQDIAIEAADEIVTLVRQILDALLRSTAPDLDRARSALQVLRSMSLQAGYDLSDIEDELAYRRLQIAVHENDENAIRREMSTLNAMGGQFAENAERLLYGRAWRAWNENRRSASFARPVAEYGARVLLQFDDEDLGQAAVASLYNSVAEAAFTIWFAEADETMRDIALRLDRAQVEFGRKTTASLRRLAIASEAVGETQEALEAWRMLLAGLPLDSEAWFEARYQSIRLLQLQDPDRAKEVMSQHVVLHPQFGPEPWGDRLRQLRLDLETNSVPDNPTLPPEPEQVGDDSGGGGGGS